MHKLIDIITHWPIKKEDKQKVLDYFNNLNYKGLPVILNFDQLAAHLKISSFFLYQIAYNSNNFYREFKIPKRKGGFRTISMPMPSLLQIQRQVNEDILLKCFVSSNAFGFVRGKNIVGNAREHLGNNCLLKLDIKDFFPTINIKRVYGIFKKLGYSKEISSYLAKICCFKNAIPQGAATSPAISNIVMYKFDRKMEGFCKKNNLKYTRYADDITISGNQIGFSLVFFIEKELMKEGFILNKEKTILSKSKSKKIVTGISISSGETKLPKNKKRDLRKEIYYIEKFGILEHMKKNNFFDPIYLDRLKGKINFWLQVEPDNTFAKKALGIIQKENKFLDNIEVTI